jgi:hypothetical protein
MAKYKTVTHLPAPPAPPAPRLAVQLLVIMGEVAVIGAAILGFMTVGRWVLLADTDMRREARQPRPPVERVCWRDRHGEVCESRQQAPRRNYTVSY